MLGIALCSLPNLQTILVPASSYQDLRISSLQHVNRLSVSGLNSQHAPFHLPNEEKLVSVELTMAPYALFLPWNFLKEMPRLNALTVLKVSHFPMINNPTLRVCALPSLTQLHLIECEAPELFLALAGEQLTDLAVQPVAWTDLADFLSLTRCRLTKLHVLVHGEQWFADTMIDSILMHSGSLQDLMMDGRWREQYMKLSVRLWRRLAGGLPGLRKLALRMADSSYHEEPTSFSVSRFDVLARYSC